MSASALPLHDLKSDSMDFKIFASTTKGTSHSSNEDSYAVGKDYLVLADGMGGAAAGKTASEIVVKTISECLDQNLVNTLPAYKITDILTASIEKAGTEINRYVELNPDTDGMGSTVLIIVLCDKIAHIAWCGDSRCYVSNSEKTESLTKDHSYVRLLLDNNLITEEESFTHPENNIIIRCIGAGNDIAQPEIISYRLKPGEILIACSDGLSGYCRNHEIQQTVALCKNYKLLPQKLTELACLHGSDDDITISIITDIAKPNPFVRAWCSLMKCIKRL